MTRWLKISLLVLTTTLLSPTVSSACFLPLPWCCGWCWNPFDPCGVYASTCGSGYGYGYGYGGMTAASYPGMYGVGASSPTAVPFPPRPAAWGGYGSNCVAPQPLMPAAWPAPQPAAMTSYRNVSVDLGSYQQVWVPRMVTRQVPSASYQATGFAPRTMPAAASYPSVATSVGACAPCGPSTAWHQPTMSSPPASLHYPAQTPGTVSPGAVPYPPSTTSTFGTTWPLMQSAAAPSYVAPPSYSMEATTMGDPSQNSFSFSGVPAAQDFSGSVAGGGYPAASMTQSPVQVGTVDQYEAWSPTSPAAAAPVQVPARTARAPQTYERRSKSGLFSPVRPGSHPAASARHTSN